MLKVGITGGIGSGKTTVCKIFSTLGVPVYYADDRGKELMNTDPEIRRQLITLFGDAAYTEHGLDRKYIAEKVFSDKGLLQQLNALVHPAVFKDSFDWFQRHQADPYVLYEAAILFETGSYKMMDKMITVVAPLEVRIERTMQRDAVSRDEVLERVDKQLSDEEKIKMSDFIIYNDQKESLIDQVMRIHRQLLATS